MLYPLRTLPVLLLASTTLAQGPQLVTMSTSLDSSAIAPNASFTLAVTLTPKTGYHLYWSNPGESGIPTSITPKLPDGFKLQALPLPLPKAFVQPGNITGYGYTGPTTFLFTVTAPATLPPDVPAGAFRATARWLCCDEQQCVPGSAKSFLNGVTYGSNPKPLNEDLFAAARASLPANAPPEGLLKKAIDPASHVADKKLTFTLPLEWTNAPTKVEAFPDAPDTLDVSVPTVETTEGKTTISLTARILAGQTPKSNKLPLLIVYTTGDGKRQGFFQTLDLSPLSKP